MDEPKVQGWTRLEHRRSLDPKTLQIISKLASEDQWVTFAVLLEPLRF